jgi:uncharacterized protein YwbE
VLKREIQRGSDGKRQEETDGESNRGINVSVKRQRGSQREKIQRGVIEDKRILSEKETKGQGEGIKLTDGRDARGRDRGKIQGRNI